MDKIKKIKVKKSDGTFTDYLPLGSDAEYIDLENGNNLQEEINHITKSYDNIAAMKADTTLKAGDICQTLGYYEINDGGGAKYRITTLNGNNYENNANFYHTLNNNLYASIIQNDDGYLNIKQFGAKANGEDDDTDILQKVIDKVRNDFQTKKSLGVIKTIILPGGSYKITRTIVVSPFVKIKTTGYVVLKSYVEDAACLHLTASSDDITSGFEGSKQDWFRGPWLNGESGLLIKNYTTISDDNHPIGLKIGSDTELGRTRPTSRYEIRNMRIQGFYTGLFLAGYNNYISHFENISLEAQSQYCIYIESKSNSGEKLSFLNCLLAGAPIGVSWGVGNQSTYFDHCSFDFVTCIFENGTSSGYHWITCCQCHIEGFGCSPDDNSKPSGIFYGKSDYTMSVVRECEVYNSKYAPITNNNFGNWLIWENNKMLYPSPSITTRLANNEFKFKNKPSIYENNWSNGNNTLLPCASLNLIKNYGFQSESAGILEVDTTTKRINSAYIADLYNVNIDFSTSLELVEPDIDTDPTYPLTTKWLKITGENSNYNSTMHLRTDFIDVIPNKKIMVKGLFKNLNVGPSIQYTCYDEDKNVIDQTVSYVYWPDADKYTDNQWAFHPYTIYFGVPGWGRYVQIKMTTQWKKGLEGGFGGMFLMYA